MQQRTVYWNGELVPEDQARVSIYDSALMFGDVAFDMTRSFNKVQFKLREHLERFKASASWLHIPLTTSVDELEEICQRVITANEPTFQADDEHRLMVTVTRGLLGVYSGRVSATAGTNLIVADYPLRWTVQDMADLFHDGIDIVIPGQQMIPASLLEPKAKTRNRIHYLQANVEVSHYKGKNAWALLRDPSGFLTEGTGANFFLVKDGCLYTPEPRNILRGISRQYVMELATDLKIPVYERNLEAYDLMTADEAFFTATPFCMLPATRFTGRPLGQGGPGPVFQRLLAEWSVRVGVDIAAQVRRWSDDNLEARANPYAFEAPKA